MKKDYLIIDRAKWRTGGLSHVQTGEGGTALLNNDGFMCCLGFRCHQMGIPKKDLLGKWGPSDVANWNIPDLVNDVDSDTEFSLKANHKNDSAKLPPEEKESEITEHFATICVTVEFKCKYPKK
jgi:hypothetical protein